MTTIVLPRENESVSAQEQESSEDESEEIKLTLANEEEDEVEVSPTKRNLENSATENESVESTKISDRENKFSLSQEDEKIAKDSEKLEILTSTQEDNEMSNSPKSLNEDETKSNKKEEKISELDPELNENVGKISEVVSEINENKEKNSVLEDEDNKKVNKDMEISEINSENEEKVPEVNDEINENREKISDSDDEINKKINKDKELVSESDELEEKNTNDDLEVGKNSEKPAEVTSDLKVNEIEKKVPESDEDDDNFASFKFTRKLSQTSGKKFALVDSDSDDENIFSAKKQDDEETSSISEKSVNSTTDSKSKKKSRISNILDSDTEDESEGNLKDETSQNSDSKSKKKSRISNILDSDTEDESEGNLKDETSQNSVSKSNNSKKLTIVDSDSENESAQSSDDEKDQFKKQKTASIRKDLIDSDSDSDGNRSPGEVSAEIDNNEAKKKKKSAPKRKGSARASKDAAMHQIHSESQRLIRESEVSLPYHRPKQRTLQEFLNRKKISSSLPKTLTTAAKVKMFDDVLIKAVEEKEKEAESFYKSSDSEEEIQLPMEETVKNSTDHDQKTNNFEYTPMDTDNLFNEGINFTSNILNQETEIEDSRNNGEEVPIESNKDTNIAQVSRRLFENEVNSEKNLSVSNEKIHDEEENLKNAESAEHPAMETDINEKICDDGENSKNVESDENPAIETDINEKLCVEKENSKNAESAESSAMETDTNDFELRFSVHDFDTELNLKDLEGDFESGNLSKSEENLKVNKPDEEKVDEIDENSMSVGEKEKEADGGLEDAISKGHVLGLPPPSVEDEIARKKSLKQKILSRFLNVKPTLHGSPGTTIELSEDVNKDGVKKLLDRFVRHSQIHKIEENPDVTVIHTEVTPDGLKIVEQVLPYKTPNADESDTNKPGSKLQKLREELQQKISSKRIEEWRQKEQASKALEDEFDDELEPEDKDELLNEEEFEDESAESEPEENDVIIKENKKSNCAFADDEAEVSDDNENQFPIDEEDEEGLENEREENEEEEEEEEKVEEEEEEEEENDEEADDEGEDDKEEKDKNPKKIRRIITAFEDDSDLSEPENSEKVVVETKKKTLKRLRTDADMFDETSDGWISDEENRLKADSQPSQLTSNYDNLVTPVTQLTVLNKHLDSAKESSKENDSPDQLNDSFSQDSTLGDKFSNKLFQAEPNVNDDELMDLCSGNFADPTQIKPFKPIMNSHQAVTESQLLDLCSGSFSSQIDENSQDIKLTLEEPSPMKKSPKRTSKILKIVSSDEEDDGKDEEKRRKKVAKLVLSEDEDDDDDGNNVDNEENEEDYEEELEQEDEEDNFVDYDSEENEVVVIPKKDIKKVVMKKYMEAEAELSESEWGSEDEDERDLDRLEREEGDDDEIDEDQMRKQLGKIHARQVLDDDQREVRLLQDMLFEDGDLHSEGAGRERKFRWKNIDNLGEWGESKAADDPDMIEDALEESELEIRKHRYEKAKFLEKQSTDWLDDIEKDFNDSEVFKCGLRVVNTVKMSVVVEESTTVKTKKPLAPSIIPNLLEKSSINKSPSMQLPIRGSFLARGEATLARIASIIDEKDKVIRAPLNGRRFVFEHISPSVKDAENAQTDEESTPSTSKNKSRKRMLTNDSTPKSVKKMKVDKETSGKKLFS